MKNVKSTLVHLRSKSYKKFYNLSKIISTLYRRLRSLPSLGYAKLRYWLFFSSHVEFIGEAGARIHPSTILDVSNSKIVVENGIMSLGYLPGWPTTESCHIRLHNSTLHIIGNVDLRPGFSVWAMNSKIVIHDGTAINGPTGIVSKAGVEIGAHCQISAGVQILDCDLHKHAVAGEEPKDIAKPIIIKDSCWIGLRVSILKGVIVGEGAVIGVGSVVTKNVGERTMVAGVPARKIRDNIIWEP